MSTANLPKLLQPALKALEKDLLTRAKTERVEAGLKSTWEDEQKAGQTGLGFDPWRRERVTQFAVAWILSIVFIRTLEDRGYTDPRIAGATSDALRAAEDREDLFKQVAPFLGPREYLLAVFRELSKLPGARDVFDAKHNLVWRLSPSSEGAQALLDFFRKRDDVGAPTLVFTGADTRFLGDLYQNLSEVVRKRYALLQTPEFVEEFILDQTLDPAIAVFGLKDVTLIDPTCGSGHFLLGAFRRLLGRWQKESPAEHVADLARRALDQVYGVDINPYAVAIARFRLVLALLDAVGIKRLEGAPEITPNVVVADSLLHRFAQGVLTVGQTSMDDLSWGNRLYRLENRRDVERVLTKRFHAVVGNPPYITEKDPAKKKKFHEMYESAAGKYSLSAPFTERFFELATPEGFVGLINSNAWAKRDFGKTLVEKVLPRFDVQEVIDTSGCYLPGHGTPTLLLFGRNRTPGDTPAIAVLGKRGEQEVPPHPATAPVWSEIVQHHTNVGFEGTRISVEQLTRSELRQQPWILSGGGARALYLALNAPSRPALKKLKSVLGYASFPGMNDAFAMPRHAARNAGMPSRYIRDFVVGESVRDWSFHPENVALAPYDEVHALVGVNELGNASHHFWVFRTTILSTTDFGGATRADGDGPHWAWYRWQPTRYAAAMRLSYPRVSTHNHVALDRGGHVFNEHAPVLILKKDYGEVDYQALLGYLNSSLVAFWCRLVMFPKGGDQVGEGARLSKTPWQDRLEYAGKLLQQLPVPNLDDLREKLLDLVIAAEKAVQELEAQLPAKIVATTLAAKPTLAALRDARAKSQVERARLRGTLVSLQEEIDWRVYGLFGLPTAEAPSVDAVRVVVEPNQRPFEVRLARETATDVSASEWFRVHKREAPEDVSGPHADLYRQRLRLLDSEQGKQLRLLETPETKRRWSPPDDAKGFADAVRMWLLERIEAVFCEQPTPELCTARQLAVDLGRDPAVAAAHELLTEESGLDLVTLFSNLVDMEGVPFLAGYRYAETGMEKRATWEETWRLQRLQDEGTLALELERLELRAIQPPDKYGPKDFLRHYWSLRGKLDVPKERFITVPGGNADEDSTPLVGWAGWNQLQVAQALSAVYQRRKTEDGWQKDRLNPLLAGISARVPWLLQWHNDVDPTYGTKLGDFFRDFVAGEAHALGVVVSELRTWTPPTTVKRTTIDPTEVFAALQRWKPDLEDYQAEDDDDEEVELPEGPTEVELATEVGVKKALVAKALKKLIADGVVEKLVGRPARYIAIGEQP